MTLFLRDYHPSDPRPWTRPSDWPVVPFPVAGAITALIWLRADMAEGASIQIAYSPTPAAGAAIDWGDGVVDPLPSSVWVDHEFLFNGPGTVPVQGGRVAILRLIPPTGAQVTQLRVAAPQNRTTTRGSGPVFLDLEINLPHANTISIANGTTGHFLRRFRLHSAALVTNLGLPLRGLADCGPINLPSVLSVSLFTNCINLREIPPISAPLATSAVSLFSGAGLRVADCSRLNLPNVTNWNSAFANCPNLEEVINLDHRLQLLGSTFSGSRLLRRIQGRSTVPTTDCGGILSNCTALESVELELDTATVTNWATAFQYYPLPRLPNWVFSSGRNFNQAFRYSYLEDLSPLDGASPTESIFYAMASCPALVRPPQWTLPQNLTALTPTQRVYDGNTSLQDPWMVGLYESQDLRNLPMSTAQIAAMLGTLREVPTAIRPQTIWLPRPAANGVAQAVLDGATAKGWTLA